MHKVFVIGIDAGNLDLILKWKDELPNLRRFIEGGVYGRLESTIPPITSPAWNCMFTGKNPAKIGIFDFIALPINKQREFKTVNYSYQKAPSLWDILGNLNKKVGIVNVPTTFPPTKVNGFMVSGGLLAPIHENLQYTFPPRLQGELNSVANGYEITPYVDLTALGKEKRYIQKWVEHINKQVMALKYLLRTYEWELFVHVFFVTDHVQHYLWHHMDETHPLHNADDGLKYGHGIKTIYKEVDKSIGEIMKNIPEETNIIVVSDHGSGPLYGYFQVNEWLRQEGLLVSQKGGSSANDALFRSFVPVKNFLLNHLGNKSIQFLMEKGPKKLLERFTHNGRIKYELARWMESIDWTKTKAYGLASYGISINLKGREPGGIVEPDDYEGLREEISDKLYKIRHPLTGKGMVTKVFKREEIYNGKYLDSAPDLLYILDECKYIQRLNLGENGVWVESPTSGGHSLYGTFIAWGPDVKSTGEELQGFKIYDITPTVLHLMDCPVPEDVDGRVLTEILAVNSEPARRPIAYQAVGERERVKDRINRLKGLARI